MIKFVVHVIAVIFTTLCLSSVSWSEEDEAAAAPKVQYFDLEPPFVTNFGQSTSKLKYIKASVAIRASGMAGVTAVQEHEPAVRHEIVMLLSSLTEESISSGGGQEAIRQDALSRVQAVLEEKTGASQIDDLLFTSFVVQR